MRIPDEKVAWLHTSVLEFMTLEAEAKAPLETGGVLLGYFSQPGSVPVILYATGPGPHSIHQRYLYKPDSRFDESEIARLYALSGRRVAYLGDWHTHPGSACSLSERDRRTLRRIAICRAARVKTPVMLVLSLNGSWRPVVWQGSLSRRYILTKDLLAARLGLRLFD
jgi:integrative and conjugative element protein (TIGR02256 family)